MTKYQEYNTGLFNFINNSPTAFHAVSEIRTLLLQKGFSELYENQYWKLEKGKPYFVIRNDSALAAFTLGSEENPESGFRMIGSHSDSPGLQVKPAADTASEPYLQIGVEIYGGPLLNPWFDRDLGLAGRVCCTDGSGKLCEYLIDFQRPLLTIPSLAIHFDREANDGRPIDKQKFLPPLFAQTLEDQLPDFTTVLKNRISEQYPQAKIVDILGFDMFCYDHQKASYLGLNNEFITCSRLDNLLSCFVGTSAMGEAGVQRNTLFLCTNHEENGSTSTSGAQSSFVENIFARLIPAPETRQIALRNSLFISVDNAHAIHPNFREKSDPNHNVILNGGPVIKNNANQRYATNCKSSALFKLIAREADVPVQEFVMQTGMPCGSTIGPMTAAKLGIETIDIGAPTLSMHSIRELTGSQDPYLMHKVIHSFLSSPELQRR